MRLERVLYDLLRKYTLACMHGWRYGKEFKNQNLRNPCKPNDERCSTSGKTKNKNTLSQVSET